MSNERRIPNLTIRGAKLILKNFQGKVNEYNKDGRRTFGILLSDEDAEAMLQDGWGVKFLKPRPDDPEQYQQPWLKVEASYRNFPPLVYLITSAGKVRLTEETIGQLDWTAIDNVDIIINPYYYEPFAGNPAGIKAYLKTLYVTVQEDDLAAIYADIPDIG